MGLKMFNKALAILHCDFRWLLFNSFDAGELTPEVLRRQLVREVVKLGLWLWDPFNFNTMTVPQAIEIESERRVVDTPVSELSVPAPGIGYSVREKTSGGYHYEIIVNDTEEDSEFASSIQQKFKMAEPTRIEENDGVWSFFYDLYTT